MERNGEGFIDLWFLHQAGGSRCDRAEAHRKGPDGGYVLFPHLPYLLEENVLISEEEKKALLSLRKRPKAMMQSFP